MTSNNPILLDGLPQPRFIVRNKRKATGTLLEVTDESDQDEDPVESAGDAKQGVDYLKLLSRVPEKQLQRSVIIKVHGFLPLQPEMAKTNTKKQHGPVRLKPIRVTLPDLPIGKLSLQGILDKCLAALQTYKGIPDALKASPRTIPAAYIKGSHGEMSIQNPLVLNSPEKYDKWRLQACYSSKEAGLVFALNMHLKKNTAQAKQVSLNDTASIRNWLNSPCYKMRALQAFTKKARRDRISESDQSDADNDTSDSEPSSVSLRLWNKSYFSF